MKDNLTIQQAYAAMYWYLCGLFEVTKSNELGGMLGSMSLLDDNRPADPAVWGDWLIAVEKALQEKEKIELGLKR